MTTTLTDDQINAQHALEIESRALGMARYRAQREKRDEADLPPGLHLITQTIQPLSEAIEAFVADMRAGGARRLGNVVSFLEQFEPGVIAFLTARRTINALSHGEGLTKASLGVAGLLIDELEHRAFKQEAPGLYFILTEQLKRSTSTKHRRGVWRHAAKKANVPMVALPLAERSRVGQKLIELMAQSTGLCEIVKQSEGRHKSRLVVRATETAQKWLETQHARCELLSPVHLPMIVPPKPWTDPTDGGYYNRKIGHLKLVKTRNRNYLEEVRQTDMPIVYRAINALQETPWRINKSVLAVMREVWDNGGELGGLPARDDKPLPAKPADIDTDADALRAWKRNASRVYGENARLRSKRLAQSQKLWVAEKFAEEPAIYFPHVCDWRGRAYPVPAYTNPQSDDAGRALLQFAEGLPLGGHGVWWLAVHIANLFGVDKVSLEDRVAWTYANTWRLVDSAFMPLEGQRFWATADEPYQALAACFEWAGVQIMGSEYVSHLPVALDGSCNGLQNFSAMLRDEVGGAATNLVPADVPSDIYQQVADVVSAKLASHAVAGNTEAALWVGKIDRKLVKRNVMTLPYGCRQFGMRGQLLDELSKREEDGAALLADDVDKFDACQYLSGVVYDAIGEVVIAARRAMTWLQDAARVVAAEGLPIHWYTPAGFLVLQEYRKVATQRIETHIGGARVSVQAIYETDNIDRRKQAQGIAPNFVHSMDSAHMMLTVDRCLAAGIQDFAMVHDSYATHAANCEPLSVLLRESFVEMYSTDVLKAFRDILVAQLPPEVAEKLPPLPPSGKLDLSGVLDSRYFFA